MFRASSCPSSGATTTAVAPSGLPSERGDSAVGRGRAGRQGGFIKGVYRFSKNLEAVLKFQAPYVPYLRSTNIGATTGGFILGVHRFSKTLEAALKFEKPDVPY
jgi:hypothetical protein